MKKSWIFIFLLIFSVAIFSSPQRRIEKRVFKAKFMKLKAPENRWEFDKSPVTVRFEWVHPGDVDNFTLFIEVLDKGLWKSEIIKSNIRANFITLKFSAKSEFRWSVEGKRGNLVLYKSGWRHCIYTGAPKPQFYPVPTVPKNNKVFKNYPRKMTFQWLHSTNPAYRRYQIQIDIYHPRPKIWRSDFKEMTYLVDQIVLKNSFRYNFPADRKGRWRVRGVATGKRYTPWSKWKYFEFRALH